VTALARCLPSNQLSEYDMVENTVTVNEDDSGISFGSCQSPDVVDLDLTGRAYCLK
jgi:hypothetical protein